MRKHVSCLLFIPVVAALVPWAYNRRNPALFGIPFFYWFQLMLVPLGSAVLLLVIASERGPRTDRSGGSTGSDGESR